MNGLEILSIAPSATVQDRGRTGLLRYGVTSGGAMDIYALAEGQALLGNGGDDAAIEFAEYGGRFRALGPVWVAFSGARMTTRLNGSPVSWRRNLFLHADDVLDIGAAETGVYGYLHVAGGFQTDVVLGSRSTHLRAGFGHVLAAGQTLAAGEPERPLSGAYLPEPAYFDRRGLHVLWGPQSQFFEEGEKARFAGAEFEVTKMRDRMGIQIRPDSGPVSSAAGLTIASDAISLGDIQVTGDGTPAILLADRGSSGGYPRIATVASADIPMVAQSPTGQKFTMDVVDRADAVALLANLRRDIRELPRKVQPLLRDPRDMADLLAYNLVDGVLRGDEFDQN